MVKEIQINDLFIPLLNEQTEVLLLYGGAGSGKSYFAHQKIVLRTLSESPHKFLVLRKVANTIKNSCFDLIKQIIVDFGAYGEFEINKTEKTFLHLPTGNQILCKGLDEPEKIKSIQGITGVLFEELTEFTFDDFTQILLRVRGEHKNYVQFIGCFNPVSEYSWIKTNIIEKLNDLNANGNKYKYVHSTYKDNHFLTAEDKARLEALKLTNKLYYDVYCLGEWGIEDKSGKFAFAFSEDKHVKPVTWNPELYTYLSFDFNVNPISCLAIQNPAPSTIRVVKEFKLGNSNIYSLCEHIKAIYPHASFIVTGDATGRNTSALVKDKLNYYKVIKEQLSLTEGQIQVPSINPPMVENKVLFNALLENGDVLIDPSCVGIIYDCKYVEVDEQNKIVKVKT